MGPRRTSQERRRQIIAVATDLFSQKGFRGTTTKEIAERAGVSEAIIFRHFSTKRALYHALLDAKTHSEGVLARATEAARTGHDAAVFRAVAGEMVASTEKDPTLMRLLLFSALEAHDLSGIFFESRVRRLHEFLSEYISRGIAAGRFRSVNPLVAARAFVAMPVHYVLIHELFKVPKAGGMSTEKAIETFVAIFLRGLRQEATRGGA